MPYSPHARFNQTKQHFAVCTFGAQNHPKPLGGKGKEHCKPRSRHRLKFSPHQIHMPTAPHLIHATGSVGGIYPRCRGPPWVAAHHLDLNVLRSGAAHRKALCMGNASETRSTSHGTSLTSSKCIATSRKDATSNITFQFWDFHTRGTHLGLLVTSLVALTHRTSDPLPHATGRALG